MYCFLRHVFIWNGSYNIESHQEQSSIVPVAATYVLAELATGND
jgi:hypothetical protein